MHSTPANLTFGSQPLPKALRYITSFIEGLDNFSLIGLGVLRPISHATSRINPHHPIRASAKFAQPSGDAAGLANLFDKVLALFVVAHGRTTPGRRPHRSDD